VNLKESLEYPVLPENKDMFLRKKKVLTNTQTTLKDHLRHIWNNWKHFLNYSNGEHAVKKKKAVISW
jgi:hypothetical protein